MSQLPVTEDDDASGTSAHGVVRAVEEIAAGRLAALPVTGLGAPGVRALLRAAAEGTTPLRSSRTCRRARSGDRTRRAAQLAAYLERGDLGAGPPADWSVGHFVGLVGLDEGRAGALVMVADTYPAIGLGGVHLQPVEAVAAALDGRGVLVIAEPDVARRVADAAGGSGELWDNGSPIPAARVAHGG